MKRPALSELAQVAEIIAAIGVIVSLIYVAFELRDNTSAVRATTAQVISDSSRAFLLDISLDEELSLIRMKGNADINSLSELEKFRFSEITLGNWLYMQNVWTQWTLNAVDDRVWETYRRIMCAWLGVTGTRQLWAQDREVLDPEYVVFIENCSAAAD